MVSSALVLSETSLFSVLAVCNHVDINVIVNNGFKDSDESWLYGETSVFLVVFDDFFVAFTKENKSSS